MRRVVIASLIAVAEAAGVAGQEPSVTRDVEALLADARCADRVRSSLRAESVDVGLTFPEPPGRAGTRAVRMPTGTFGTWLRVSVEPDGAVTLERVSAGSRHVITYDRACREHVETYTAARPPDAGSFTDARLGERLARGDTGVILLWSPHMPLSVDEYAVLEETAATMKLALVAVLDPAADLDYARRVARERGMPESSLMRLAGVELAFRGMTTHAPSVQVFADGKLIGPALYGYRDGAAARAAISGILGGR